jgi:hypothetical protein
MTCVYNKGLLQYCPEASWSQYSTLENSLDLLQSSWISTQRIHSCNKHNINISLMWDDRYLRNTSELRFRNKVEFESVIPETLKISVTTKYCNSVGGFLGEFSLPKLGDTCRISRNICWLLRAVAHPFQVTQKGFSHPFLVALVANITTSDYELPTQQN